MAIDYKTHAGVAYITLNNPDKANVLDKQTSDAISDAWIDLWEDREIRCAIVTGAVASAPGLLGRLVSEYGESCHGDGGHEGAGGAGGG